MIQPLPIPDDFNPSTFLIAKYTENGTFHESRQGARFAEELIANGTPDDLALAESVMNATLACQEVNPADPHYGNFYWMAEDDVVADLNAVEFCLEHLIPIMLRYADRLQADTQRRVLHAIRLGLDEIRRLDVHVGYSNITMLDILNSCLGGELLGDDVIAQRGYDKLVQWILFTNQSGVPREYNSPTYTRVMIHALKRLIDLTTHAPTRTRAKMLTARLGLSVILHMHRETGRWAGPHSRAYHPSVVCERPPELVQVRQWLQDGHLPAWLSDVLMNPNEPFSVIETASITEDMGYTTHQSKHFALGVATKEYGGQADVLMAHYVRDGAERPGVMYTRYVMDDKWLGDFYHATDRTASRNLIEEGRFFGVQNGASAIGVYAPQNMSHCHSAKAAFIFTQAEHVDAVWLNGEQVQQLPVDIPEQGVIVIESGHVYIALQPLTRHDAGRDAPMQLIEKEGDIVFEMYNYKGTEKDFWEMRSSLNPFFQGHAYSAVYIEIAEKTSFADATTFTQHIISGQLNIQIADPFTTDFVSERPLTLGYTRDDMALGLTVDVMGWTLTERWTQDGVLGFPLLESPVAVASDDGEISLGGARVTFGDGVVWLYANSDKNLWVVGIQSIAPMPLQLQLPTGSLTLDAIGTGVIVWDGGQVTIDANDQRGTPQLIGGQLVSLS